MRRTKTVLAVVAVMAAMLVAFAAPALADNDRKDNDRNHHRWYDNNDRDHDDWYDRRDNLIYVHDYDDYYLSPYYLSPYAFYGYDDSYEDDEDYFDELEDKRDEIEDFYEELHDDGYYRHYYYD